LPTTLDCDLLRDLYGTAELREAFSTTSLVQSWLDVERALAEAQAEVGMIPSAAAERIAAEADASAFDFDPLRDGIAASTHPLVPLVRVLAERCGDQGGWVHWGATTQDVMDTGLVLQMRRGLGPVRRDLDRCVRAAADLAHRYARTPMAGRTHGQHAVPITFGLKAATWADELDRARTRLDAARATVLTAQLSGAAGTFASLGGDAQAVQEAFARRLGLTRPAVHWHSTRDRQRDLAHALAEIASAAERIAAEVIRLQQTEVAEVREPSTEDHVGSSTMPQKRNPMTCEYIVASARLLRGATGVLVDAPAHAFERDMALWAAEWIALPQAFILAGGIVDKLVRVLEGLIVDEERMRQNLALTRGRLMAESVMMALGRWFGHERAHQVVMRASRRAAAADEDLASVLLEDAEVAALAGEAELAQLLEPSSYLGLAPADAEAVAARVNAAPEVIG
jgi:adenylosuccinate lyase/3-carboxy-cis,cis-muconate cycloisomerase